MNRTLWSLLLCSRVVFANPVGETVTGGDVAFTRDGKNELHVFQTSDRAVVEWEKFSIDAGELTKFLQPGPDAVLLNKVIGSEISAIYGKLEANGQIILMNPHGVLVGKTGVIDACAFMAVSHDVNNVEFMDGKFDYSVSDLSGVINVDGRVDADRIEIIGDRIFLTGGLTAPGGEIEVRGNEIFLSGDLDVSAFENGNGGRAIVVGEKIADFSGSIYAKGGEFGGDGGFIEVSSHGQLGLTGKVSTLAPHGQTGMFLIDPTDVLISFNADQNTTGPGYNYTGTPVNIQSAALVGFLNASSVTIDTANTVDQGEPGNLTIDGTADFTGWVGGNSLILLVDGDLVNDATIGAVGTGVQGNFLAQVKGNITINAPIYTDGGNISLRAGPLSGLSGFNPAGGVTLNEVLNTIEGGTLGGTITVQGFDITSTNGSTPHRTNSGNIDFFANQDIIAQGLPTFLTTDTGAITVYANRNITLTPGGGITGTGPFSGLQLDIRADYDLDGVGDLFFQSVSGNSSGFIAGGGGDIFVGAHNLSFLGSMPGNAGNGHGIIVTVGGGSIEVQVRNDFNFTGGNGVGNSAVFISSSSSTLVRAGHDIILQGGTGAGSAASVAGTTSATLIAGNDIQMLGGAAPGGVVNASALVSADQCFLTAGQDIILTPGPNASDSAIITSDIVATTMRSGRHILFSLGATGGEGKIIDNGVGCDVRAGGDIVWATDFKFVDSSQPIYIAADAPLIPVYSAQVGPYLAGTPLATTLNVVKDGRGAFSVNTSPNVNGIALNTIVSGSITLYSAARDYNGNLANIVFSDTAANGLNVVSFGNGDISIGSFYNTDIENTISTAGSILVATNNNMNINTPTGFITAGGPITLIVDEETPLVAGPGFFNNFNSGVSTTDPEQRIAIYAASGPLPPAGFSFPNQVVLGNLSSVETWDVNKPLGLLSKYDTSFEGGGPIHGGGFGANYVAGNGVFSSPVIWYKIFQPLTAVTDDALFALQQLRTEVPERLWLQEFSILVDRQAFTNHIKVLMNQRGREGTIQSRVALASSKDYFLHSTMSGENIRIMDRYQEFEQSPFWRTPEMMKTLYWLEDRQ